MSKYKKCCLCETENTDLYFDICVRCHLKIDEKMGYCITDERESREYKQQMKTKSPTSKSVVGKK